MPPQKPLTVEICAIDRASYRLEAVEVLLPGEMGLFAVLPGHAPLVATLDIGTVRVRLSSGETKLYAINGGLVRVFQDEVLVLSRTAEAPHDIDVERAQASRERAEKRLAESHGSLDILRAHAALRRATARLQASGTESTVSHA